MFLIFMRKAHIKINFIKRTKLIFTETKQVKKSKHIKNDEHQRNRVKT